MNRLLLSVLALIALSVCCEGHSDIDLPSGKIINGMPATIEQHPYQVSVQTLLGPHFCGGALIKENFVLTAAHCVEGRSALELKVRLGSTSWAYGGKVVLVKSINVPNDYNSDTLDSDVAVLKLIFPVILTSKIRTIELAVSEPVAGTNAVVTGWGNTVENVPSGSLNLQAVEVPIVDRADCGTSYNPFRSITERMMCAGTAGRDACQGDSGGPLVANGQLVGVVSWGYGCARPNYPGVYSSVPALRSYITQVTGL
ncbi:trypsin-like [Drosophila takahashii]|uniref:trypsin-like n=1 Tax=Drosophila takahashii TaxID=29030 RepID=UPI0038994141